MAECGSQLGLRSIAVEDAEVDIDIRVNAKLIGRRGLVAMLAVIMPQLRHNLNPERSRFIDPGHGTGNARRHLLWEERYLLRSV